MLLRMGIGILATGLVMVHAGTITDVVPNKNASVNGSYYEFYSFGEAGAVSYTFQWELAASQLTSLVGDSLTAIGFRLNSGTPTVSGPTVITSFNLELSPAVNPIGSLSTTFANNIGPGGVTVYNNSLTLGPLTGGVGPNPFFVIVFSTPYTYTGGNLVMTETIFGGSNFSVDANYYGDGYGDTVENLFGGVLTETAAYPITEFQATAASTPEPGTLLTLAGGLLVLGARSLHKPRASTARRAKAV
jgi:hypothetical protein